MSEENLDLADLYVRSAYTSAVGRSSKDHNTSGLPHLVR